MSASSTAKTLVRWRWHIRGQVQGVGFRPFVYRIAVRAGVTGHVLNDSLGVLLEVQGDEAALAQFKRAFAAEMPPLARVDQCAQEIVALIADESGFRIDASAQAADVPALAAVTVDTAVCAECLAEMRSPTDRRYGHALINCTNCGPRFSIVRDVPYDRVKTTMAGFAMCPACRAEYEDPGDRRFHAQPVCCPECGPQVELLVRNARSARFNVARSPAFSLAAAVQEAARLLLDGKIVAIKGIGGFHLALRADWAEAVDRLRALKQRDAKPFALMCASLEHARELVILSPEGERELVSARAPIVLAPRTAAADAVVAAGVAAGTHLLGVMVPYTPLQHLIFDAMRRLKAERKTDDRLKAELQTPALVMTSGNLSNEPLVIDNADAVARLGPLCDAILWHDRPIERCVDDSVLLDRVGAVPLPVRRSRGYVPTAWRLGNEKHATGICVGGELKNTAALVRRGEIILSQHFGDLSHALAYEHFLKGIDDLVKLFDVRSGDVQFVAHDLHPSYISTHAARVLAERFAARLVPVQHHVAHAAGLLGEHRIEEPALVVVCDGTGFGTDGTIWGGELFAMNLPETPHWQRLGRLRPMRLCGGDAAARETRRCGLALLQQAYGEGFEETEAARALYPDAGELRVHGRMIRTGFNSPWTSSTGRLFDGIAALLGLCTRNDHEAQAAMEVESAAYRAGFAGHGRHADLEQVSELFEVRHVEQSSLWELDVSPLVRWLVEARAASSDLMDTQALARLAHKTLAAGWTAMAVAARPAAMRSRRAILGASGGTFCNQILSSDLAESAGGAGLRVLFHNVYPPTDAGLAFGQAIFATHWV